MIMSIYPSIHQCFVDDIPHVWFNSTVNPQLIASCSILQPCNSGCSSNLPVPATLTFHLETIGETLRHPETP